MLATMQPVLNARSQTMPRDMEKDSVVQAFSAAACEVL
jgi:hypothetical protein